MDELQVDEDGKVLVNFTELLWEDLVMVHRAEGLVWNQKKFASWWSKLKYETEEEARADSEIESEEHIRHYRLLTAETDRFNISLVQGPDRRTTPQGFQEELEFVFKKPILRDNLPTAYSFLDPKTIPQEARDYYNSPRFSLERQLNFNVPNVAFKCEGLVGGMYGRNRIQEIPEVERLIKGLVTFTHPKDILFNGKGIDEDKFKRELKDFGLNLQASYGIAMTGQGGIHVSRYHYGT